MQLQEAQNSLKVGIEANQHYPEIIGQSSELRQTLQLMKRVAPTNTTVLILGETGTGKELVARAIHNISSRRAKPMIKVNCAALPANLIESELFGHERGSFTGAIDRRIGKFEQAHQSTLFLDEIGEMPLELQVKLLRALQEKEIERIGGRTTIGVDVRIIAATNRDLEKEVEAGRFRADLFYRLNIFPIHLPALRNRREDIPLLTAHFVQKLSKKIGRTIAAVSRYALEQIKNHDWPGNIRELEHVIERSILMADDNILTQIYLPVNSLRSPHQSELASTSALGHIKTMTEAERDYILTILKGCNWKIHGRGGAAEVLDIHPSTLKSRMTKLGIGKRFLVADIH